MADSSSGSCKSLTSNYVTAGEVGSGPRSRSSEDAELCACDTFCPAGIRDEHTHTPNHVQGGTAASCAPARKAEREKLRRDRLNEQLLELSSALGEPDRPKNDKSTILGDVIQSLKGLMADVERLRAEHASLVDESQDLSQEKKELHEERLLLTSKVHLLQSQMCQQMHAMLLWMTTDPASMMSAYTANSPMHGPADVDAHTRPQVGLPKMQLPFLGSQPVHLVPAPMPVHPAIQGYYGCNARGTPYYPFPFGFSDGAPNQAELPCAQVPEGYPLQVPQSPMRHPTQPIPQGAPYSQGYGPLYPFMMHTMTENQNMVNAGTLRGATTGHSDQHPGSSSVKPCVNKHLAVNERRPSMLSHSLASLSNSAQLQQSTPALENQEQNKARSSYKKNSLLLP